MKKLVLLTAGLIALVAAAAFGATANPSPASTGYTPVVLPITGVYSSATGHLGTVKFTAPAKYRIETVSLSAKAVTGTNPTLKVLVKSGSFTNYSGTLSAAGTPKDLTAGSTRVIADESTVAVDLITGGTTPKWRDLTLFILLKRL